MPNGHRIVLHHDARLTLTTLGRVTLVCTPTDGTATELLGPGKPLALLAYLAFSPRRSATREHLIDLLWADSDPERAAHALRQTVWQLRHTLGDKALLTHNGDLLLGIPIASDRDAFLAAVEAGALEDAVERYTGEFLPDLAVPGGAEFEQWADIERIRLRTAFLRTGEALARRQLSAGHVREAQRLARRVRDADRLNESGWRLLLEALAAGNDYVAAAMEADALEHLLHADEREPEPATRAALRTARQAPPDTDTSRQTLVAELVGREKEFATVVSAWDAARRGPARHVHITAPAGLGKTRLMQDVLARLRAGGARAVYVRANPGERQIASAFAGDVAAAVVRLPGATGVTPTIAATLVALNPALSSVYSAPPERRGGEDALRSRGIATAELLLAVAEEAPLCLLLDDLHWADPQSRQILAAALARLGSGRILVVSAARPSAEQLSPGEDQTRLRLEPLSVAQTAALVGSLAQLPDEPWSGSLPRRLQAATGGSPLLILESLQLALERGSLRIEGQVWSCPVAMTLAAELAAGAALRHRIEQLDRTSQWILVTLAVAGTPLGAALLARLAARPVDAIMPLLAALEERGLVARAGSEWEPGHDEIASLALETATPEAIRAAHAGLGKTMALLAGSDPLLAPHAARHLAAGREDAALVEVWRHWIRDRRRHGDRRPAAALAADLLSDAGDSRQIGWLVARQPLATRLRLDTRQRIAAVALACLGLATGSVAVFSRTVDPVDAVLVAARLGSPDTTTVLEFALHRAAWDRLDALTLRARAPGLRPADLRYIPGPGTDGRSWLITRSFPDSGGLDLSLVRFDSAAVRLTRTRGDDVGAAFSPDGRWIVFSTARWNRWSHYDLALRRIDADSVRPLTLGDASDGIPSWSPDGTRIAFSRRYYDDRPSQVCWVTLDATLPHCWSLPPELAYGAVLAWIDLSRVVLAASIADDSTAIAVLDLDGRHVTRLRTGVGGAAASPDGRWVACLCRQGEGNEKRWIVFATAHPEEAKEIRFPAGDPAEWKVAWSQVSERKTLDRVGIDAPGSVPLNATTRLRAVGVDTHGAAIEVPPTVLTWESSDTTVATVDPTGLLVPRRRGTVVIHLSAGGWRSDSTTLTIGAPQDSTLMVEDWRHGIAAPFVPYGEPMPTVTAGTDGQPAFWNRGDGSFTSGAYTARTFPAARGLGVEVRIATPVTAVQWQIAAVKLMTGLDSARLAAWDRGNDDEPVAHTSGAECNFGYPEWEGAGAKHRIMLSENASVQSLPAPPHLASGRWYVVRLQIFPDGRCGLAIDGKPIGILESRLPLRTPYLLVLYGNSFDTRILMGKVEVWQGVKAGADWLSLRRH